MTTFNIKDLSDLLKKNLPKEKINLTAEVRSKNIRSDNMYLTLKDDYGTISATVWKSNCTREISQIKDGSKINVLGNISFYQARGSISFNIIKLLSIEGKGELMEKYEKTFKYYNDKGYFLESKKLKPPKIIKKILILTSKEGAAIQDFYFGLRNGGIKIEDILVNVIVQGNECPSNIIKYLEDNVIDKDLDYDLIVLTRGGGSFEDLFGFCEPKLIECVSKLKIPLLSAIGHQVDTTLVDHVADIVSPTPSLGAQFIVDHNKKYIDELNFLKSSFLENIKDNINDSTLTLNNYKNKLIMQYENIKDFYYDNLKEQLNEYKIKLLKLKTKYSNKKLEIVVDNKIIEKVEDLDYTLKKKKEFSIVIGQKVYTITDYQVK